MEAASSDARCAFNASSSAVRSASISDPSNLASSSRRLRSASSAFAASSLSLVCCRCARS